MTFPKIILKSRRDDRVGQGHPWVFSNEIENTDGKIAPGGLADVYSARKKFLGRGFYNPHSLIAARILTRKDEPIDSRFFSKLIDKAQRLRSLLYPGESAFRLVFGESDLIPGLVIDRYENVFVLASYCLGIDSLLPLILEGLKNNFKPECIVKKFNSPIRAMEGLKEEVEVIEGELKSPLRIEQGTGSEKVSFLVDLLGGQKSGFFFDQRENRERMGAYCKGRSVLDCFAYTGGFGVYAAKAGARDITSVESSEAACRLMQENFDLNGGKSWIMQEDVPEVLDRLQKENRKFDIIVLDPPALAKSKKNVFSALRKYEKLNELAISLLNPEGVLFSSSCSHHVGRAEFLKVIQAAAVSQKRVAQVLEMRGASRDHPLLASMPETEYLKCAILRAEK